MKRLLLILFAFLYLYNVNGQSTHQTDTISTIYSNIGSISGDTTFFSYTGTKRDLERYFYKNLFVPEPYDKPITGSCNIYLVIDKSGYITQAWYVQHMNNEVGATALMHFKQYPRLKPTYIGNMPVITKVRISICVMTDDEFEAAQKNGKINADFLVISYKVQHRVDITSFNPPPVRPF